MTPKSLVRPGATAQSMEMAQILAGAELQLVPLSQIDLLDDFNPRTRFLSAEIRERLFSREALAELTASMAELQADGRRRGVLQPLLLRRRDERFELIAGERRFHAARYAGLHQVPAMICVLNDDDAMQAAIIENSQRQQIDPISETRVGFEYLMAVTGLPLAEVQLHLSNVRKGREEDRFGLDERLKALYGEGVSSWSLKRSSILRLNQTEQQAVLDGLLSVRHAAKLVGIQDAVARQAVLEAVCQLPEPPSTQELDQLIAQHQTKAVKVSRAQRLRQLSARLNKLRGEQAAQADSLLDQLERLLT